MYLILKYAITIFEILISVERDLYEWEASRQRAINNFLEHEREMHNTTAKLVAKDLHLSRWLVTNIFMSSQSSVPCWLSKTLTSTVHACCSLFVLLLQWYKQSVVLYFYLYFRFYFNFYSAIFYSTSCFYQVSLCGFLCFNMLSLQTCD